MVAVAVAPFTLKDYTLQIETDSYEKAVSQVLFTPPSPSPLEWHGPIGSDFYDTIDQGQWTCQVDYAQDWTTATSLSRYLYDEAGETKSVVFKPSASTTGMPTFTVDVIIAHGPIGGPGRQVATASVTMTCKAKPVLVPAA